MCRGLVCFDVDGTLVPGTSSSQFLAAHLGHLSELAAAESGYARGEISNHDVSVLDAAGWRGATPTQVKAWLTDLPLIDGLEEVVDWCHKRDLLTILGTLAWAPVGSYLRQRFGFQEACGPELALSDGHFTGCVASHFDEHDKRDFVLRLASQKGLSTAQCAAIGDSRSDFPTFEVVGLSIALNATPDLQAAADELVNGSDLRDVLPQLERWQAAL